MSVLAWLMLVVTSLAAAPRCAEHHHGSASHAMATTAVAYAQNAHAAAVRGSAKAAHSCCDGDGDCCGGPSNTACGCAAMNASVLPSAVATVAAVLPMAMAYASPARVRAPTTDLAPPLRPPSV